MYYFERVFEGSLRSLDFWVVDSLTHGSSYLATEGYGMEPLRGTPGRGFASSVEDCRSVGSFEIDSLQRAQDHVCGSWVV